ncbi:MAG: precorrin-2 C(20)-methyltransferase [Solirubrobacterales bacterium]|nr:precorrin-2 C(20)-methyltransferase [Solirubrobacterales bacterium]
MAARHTAGRAGSGRLFGVGVGPGDPELMTVKARRVIAAADVISYPNAQHGRSVARRIAACCVRADHIELPLAFPVTTEVTDHPGGYEAALGEFYDEAAAALAVHLDAGRDVAVLCEGDPFFYGSYMYLHERLAGRYETSVIPGVTGFSAAAASAGTPLVKRDDVFMALPGTLSAETLATRLRSADAAVVMKLGRTFAKVRGAVEAAGAGARGVYVERASSTEERIAPLRDVDGEVPYMSLVLVPTLDRRRESEDEGERARQARRGSVAVVGLGPAGPDWLTPEAHAELAAADDLVGYETYLARVPERRGQRRHASENRVESERARHALELAAGGSRVAVVSSGDPGIFAMAAAVLETLDEHSQRAQDAQLVADPRFADQQLASDPRFADPQLAADPPRAVDPRFADIEVRVVPGVSAMQAAASRVGAPLGHDFCAISLSDQLKPWDIVEKRLDAAGAADLVLALYNPASRTRREQLARAVAVLRRHRADSTPVVVARAVGDAEHESVIVTTLGALDLESVDMRTLLIVGSSTTRAVAANGRPARVYTPRRYPA